MYVAIYLLLQLQYIYTLVLDGKLVLYKIEPDAQPLLAVPEHVPERVQSKLLSRFLTEKTMLLVMVVNSEKDAIAKTISIHEILLLKPDFKVYELLSVLVPNCKLCNTDNTCRTHFRS